MLDLNLVIYYTAYRLKLCLITLSIKLAPLCETERQSGNMMIETNFWRKK